MLRAAAVASLLAACSAAGPPHGPAYTPTHSPEAESVCPPEWRAAKRAREDVLELGTGAARAAAASAVLAQAECERRALEARPAIAAGSQEEVVAQVAALRGAHRDAARLYREVIDYKVPQPAMSARLGLGRLHRAFARRLERVPDPTDMRDATELAAWRGELADLVSNFRGRAAAALEAAATSARALAGDAEADRLRLDACRELGELGISSPACSG